MSLTRITWQYVAAVLWIGFTVALAIWWLIFGLSQAQQLSAVEGPEVTNLTRVTRMLVWEGTILVGMLLAGGIALVVGIRREQRRRADMRAFFMAFTHDLKTSLTSLGLQAEALREDLPEAATNQNLIRLLKDSVRLQLQLENALFLTKTDGAVFIEPIDVVAMVDQLREDWPELRITITGQARVRADRRALESILRNLLQNAVVHGRAREVAIAIARRPQGDVSIVIEDDGVGATSDMTTVLTQPFVRPTATSGSGVGLYVCHGLLRQMGGHVTLLKHRPSGFGVAIDLPEAV